MESPSSKACPFCAEEINSNAIKCKHCSSMLDDKPVVIEQTSKRIKRIMLIFGAIAFFGVFLFFVGIGNGSNETSSFGLLTALIGAMGFCVTRVSAWWHHG